MRSNIMTPKEKLWERVKAILDKRETDKSHYQF